jgi:hypothetical protein
MRRQTLDVKAGNGPARLLLSGAQAPGAAEHAHVLALVRPRRRVPTLLALVRSRLVQGAGSGEPPPRSPIPPPTSDTRRLHRPWLCATGRPDDAA